MKNTYNLNDWLKDNADLVNYGTKKDIITKAFKDIKYADFKQLLEKMLQVDIINDEDIFDAYCSILAEYNKEFEKDSRSTGEARLTWMIDYLGYWPTVTPKSITDYLIKNHQKYGLKMIPLPDMYAWADSDEYDLGWFDIEKFDTYK